MELKNFTLSYNLFLRDGLAGFELNHELFHGLSLHEVYNEIEFLDSNYAISEIAFVRSGGKVRIACSCQELTLWVNA